MPIVVPGSTSNETPSTAETYPVRPIPRRTGNDLFKSRTSSNGGGLASPADVELYAAFIMMLSSQAPLMSMASRIASLRVLKAIDVTKIITPGSAATHGFE